MNPVQISIIRIHRVCVAVASKMFVIRQRCFGTGRLHLFMLQQWLENWSLHSMRDAEHLTLSSVARRRVER